MKYSILSQFKYFGVIFILLVKPAFSATQGDLGSSSSTKSKITLSISESVQINNVTNIHFPEWHAGDGAINGDGVACVFSTTGGYNIKALSASPNNHFALSNGNALEINYSLRWIGEQDSQSQTIDLVHATMHSESLMASRQINCRDQGGQNVKFTVSITQSDLEAASVGTYVDILTLIVAPE